ncbi:ClpP/crotonase-like domain-containing protein [Pavlovales sp. CCMP2436]|nr:ClpP/crotonase-like domain-containing protein [Pavlovales sp. CCMP2436]
MMVSTIDGVRIGPPPDLPSLLLHSRIVYVGTGLVPAVAQLIVAQLLYMQFDGGDKHYYMYINSPGTASRDGMTGFETDAFAIADTMRYIKPEAHTICLGTAYGTAAMLLSSGAKGKRTMLPNAMAMLHQPRSRSQGQASDIALRAAETLYNRRVLASLIAERSGQNLEQVEKDMGRTKYLNAQDCLKYGLVDSVLTNAAEMPAAPSFLNKL